MKKFFPLFIMLVACMTTSAYATNYQFDIKYMADNPKEAVQEAIDSIGYPEGTPIQMAPTNITSDFQITAGSDVLEFRVVKPELQITAVPDINADSAWNASQQDYLNYCVQNVVLTNVSDEYNSALGHMPDVSIPTPNIEPTWKERGGSYTLNFYVFRQYVSTTGTVHPVKGEQPEINISSSGIVSCSPNLIEFSLDGNLWDSMVSGKQVPSKWWEKIVYFRAPAQGCYSASDPVSIPVATVKQPKPEATVNEHGVLYSVPSNVEYSYDNVTYLSIKDGQQVPVKAYGQTLYMRTPASATAAASDPVRVEVPVVKAFSPTVVIDPDGMLRCSPENIEYSTNGQSYNSIRNNTRIQMRFYGQTLYFRTPSDSIYLASDPIQVAVPIVQHTKPTVSVDKNGVVHCSPENLEFSSDEKSWISIKDGGQIQTRFYDTYLYFRVPATDYYVASESVRLYINAAKMGVPSVWIDNEGYLHCDPENVEWSLDQTKWTKIQNGKEVQSTWYDKRVYFRTPGEGNYLASSITSVWCKDDQAAPKGTIETMVTSFSITITNPEQFRGCEFSIDGENWDDEYEWTYCVPETSYTVSVRWPGNNDCFPSKAITKQVKTLAGPVDALDYTKVSTSDSIYFHAEGTTQLSVSGKTLLAGYTDADVRALKNDIKAQSRHMNAVTTLDVNMTQEDNDFRDYNSIKFTMPGDMGLLQLRLHTPYFTVIRDYETTAVQITEGKPTNSTTLRNWASGKDRVYKVVINNRTSTSASVGSIKISYPWVWPDRADLDGLRVTYIDLSGARAQTLKYSVGEDGVTFTLPGNGYFSVEGLNRPYPTIPFLDSQTNWAYSYICHAYETGITVGTSATTFSPDDNVSRAQIVVFLARMFKEFDGKTLYAPLPYEDVKYTDWYAPALSFLYSRGAIKPDDTTFDPNEPMTRADIAAIIDKLFPYQGVLWTPFSCTDRADIPTYALKAVDSLYTNGIMIGTTSTTFGPKGTVTRAQLVTILYRLQTNEYWTYTSGTPHISKVPLSQSLVKDTPNIWYNDGISMIGSSNKTDVENALKYFYNKTGVHPYVVTTNRVSNTFTPSEAQVLAYAEEVNDDKFSDNGHIVLVVHKYRDDSVAALHIGSDAARVIDEEAAGVLMDYFNIYYRTDMSFSEVLVSAFRYAADDIMR